MLCTTRRFFRHWKTAILCATACLLATGIAQAQSGTGQTGKSTFAIVAWNIEGAGSDVATIRQQLDALAPMDIFALSEVPPEAIKEFVGKWGSESSTVGTTGGDSRLLLAWDGTKFDKLATEELKQIDGKKFAPGVQSAALVAELRHKPTGKSFKVMMNHLARGSASLRKTQAQLLVDWARSQQQPLIAVGGYNFDYDFIKRQGNEAFDVFKSSGVWQWIEPTELVDTNWADRNRDGRDDYPDSMLDFVFVAGPAKRWQIACEVIVRPGDFPDDDRTSDQRPIRTTVHLP